MKIDFKRILYSIKRFFRKLWEAIKSGSIKLWKTVKPGLIKVGRIIKTGLVKLGRAIKYGFGKLVELFKKLDKKIQIAIGSAALVLLVVLVFLLFGINKYSVQKISTVTDDEIDELYSNTIEISCKGDLHFDIFSTDELVSVKDIRNANLINILFKYLDRNNLLDDNLTKSIVDETAYKLFYGDISLFDSIVNFQYGKYLYNTDGKKVVRREMECMDEETVYYNNFSEYEVKDNELLVDLHIGYAKLGNLYDLNNNKLGKFVGDKSNFTEAFNTSTYYRLHYLKSKNSYKLSGVEIIVK